MLARELLEYKLDQHFEVLWILAKQHEPVTQNKLAELLQINKSRMVNIVFDLEKRNLITVVLNPADRREHYINLSASALESIAHIEDSLEKINRLAGEGISEYKLDTFFAVSEQIQQNLRKLVRR